MLRNAALNGLKTRQNTLKLIRILLPSVSMSPSIVPQAELQASHNTCPDPNKHGLIQRVTGNVTGGGRVIRVSPAVAAGFSA